MTRRARHLLLSLTALVAGTATAFAVSTVAPVDAAPPATASFTAHDFAWEVTGEAVNTTTIATGGTVTFGYPSGGSFHNVNFFASTPTSCTQTAGNNTGPVPPLPAFPTGADWSGTCRFDTPGTYQFVCNAHSFMNGTIEVVDPTATTPTTTTPTTTTPTTPTNTTPTTPTNTTPTTPTNTTPTTPTGTTPAPPTGTGPVDPPAGGPTPGGPTTPGAGGSPARPKVSVARRQRGTILRGALTTPAGRSRIVVTAVVSNRALAKRRPKQVRKVRVGSQSKRSTGTGKTPFALTLNAAAQRALHRRHRLAVDLRIVVTPPGGRAVTTTVVVVLRDA